MKIHQHNAGHMTKMAAMSIPGKNSLKVFFLGTTGMILMKLCNKATDESSSPNQLK